MKITLSISSEGSKNSIEVGHSEVALIIGFFPDDIKHAIFFAQLCEHPSSDVRSAVAGMSYMGIETLEHLAHDASVEVVRQVANNRRALKRLSNSILLEMVERDVGVAADIADNLSRVSASIREELIDDLLQHSDPKVVETAQKFVKESEENESWGEDAEDED